VLESEKGGGGGGGGERALRKITRTLALQIGAIHFAAEPGMAGCSPQ